MNISKQLKKKGQNAASMDFDSLAKLFSEQDPFALKKEDVAIGLAALIGLAGTSRNDLAAKLGYNKSRLSRLLSGSENLTLQTIHMVTTALGYDFDVVFRIPGATRAVQPWNDPCISWQDPSSSPWPTPPNQSPITLENISIDHSTPALAQ